jgi:hypothetical protein
MNDLISTINQNLKIIWYTFRINLTLCSLYISLRIIKWFQPSLSVRCASVPPNIPATKAVGTLHSWNVSTLHFKAEWGYFSVASKKYISIFAQPSSFLLSEHSHSGTYFLHSSSNFLIRSLTLFFWNSIIYIDKNDLMFTLEKFKYQKLK